MALVRIVKIPAGFAPLEIRGAWVGLEFDAHPLKHGEQALRIGTPGGPAWVVPGEDVADTLEDERPSALKWWLGNFPNSLKAPIAFSADVCEIISSTS